MNTITCEKCFKYYNKNAIISNFTYVFENQIYFLDGKNGSGKSTLYRLIVGLEKLSSGKIINNSKNILFLSNEGVGQNFLTISENIQLVYSLYKKKIDLNQDFIQQLFFENQLNTLYEKASLGMSLKVGCTLLFIDNYWDLIIIDETFSGIDKSSRKILIDRLKDIHARENTTIIITSHNDLKREFDCSYKIVKLGANNEKN